MICLDALTHTDLPLIVEWRKANPEGARTPTLLTLDQQERWYADLQEPRCQHRYWAVRRDNDLVGMVGLTYIDPDNRRAEVAILINPKLRGHGLGKQALTLVLDKGFDDMDLEQIYGEVYGCNAYIEWWRKPIEQYGWYSTLHPSVKRWGGKRWPALYFSVQQGQRRPGKQYSMDQDGWPVRSSGGFPGGSDA